MKCKDFRIEVEEGLKGDSLSIVAQDHAAGCRPCREFNQKHIEFREWLTVCRKVTAPKDFQFGVQRKIANTESAHSHGWVWDRLRYIVPATALTAVLVLAGFYLFNSGTILNFAPGVATLDTNVSTTRAGSDETRAPENVVHPESAKPGEDLAAANTSKQESNSRIAVPKENVEPEKVGGSRDSAGEQRDESKTPAGIPLQKGSQADLRDTLNILRDSGALTDIHSMSITQVLAGSVAARAGIKIGDVVQSLNGNVVTIVRDGQARKITLK